MSEVLKTKLLASITHADGFPSNGSGLSDHIMMMWRNTFSIEHFSY